MSMDHTDKVILGVVGIGAVAGIGWFLYEKSKQTTATNQSSVQSIPYSTGTSSQATNSSSYPTSTTTSSSTPTQSVTYTIPSSSSSSSNQTSTFQPDASTVTSQQTSGLSGSLPSGISGTYPTLGDPGWIANGKWYPTINQAPSGAQAAYTLDSYYDQYVQTVSY